MRDATDIIIDALKDSIIFARRCAGDKLRDQESRAAWQAAIVEYDTTLNRILNARIDMKIEALVTAPQEAAENQKVLRALILKLEAELGKSQDRIERLLHVIDSIKNIASSEVKE